MTIAQSKVFVFTLLVMLFAPIAIAQIQRPSTQKPSSGQRPIHLAPGFFNQGVSRSETKAISSRGVHGFLKELVTTQRLSAEDTDYVVTSEHISSLSGLHHIYYRQAINGIEVIGTEASLHLDDNGDFFRSNDRELIKDIATQMKSASGSMTAQQAIQTFAGVKNYGALNLKKSSKIASGYTIFTDNSVAGEILAKKAYYVVPNDGIHLVWEVLFPEKKSSSSWNVRIDAATGQIIDQFDMTLSCNITGDHDHSTLEVTPSVKEDCDDSAYTAMLAEVKTTSETTITTDGASYNVYALPLENPLFGNRTVEVDPADPVASPFGWHDTNGVAGAEFTITRGNNTYTYDDINDVNTDSTPGNDIPGTSPDGGTSLLFDFPFDAIDGQGIPQFSTINRSLEAASVNTFYWTNVCHDLAYLYGFDEASGNFQENNYGNGGTGDDSVNAEVQDGGGTCNANFFTPPEGTNPRMQMFTCETKDGVYDNLVIVHEYAHGISTRLTGGAANSGSLNNAEQMGEGWSDYYGYMWTMDATNFDDDRVVGTFLFGDDPFDNDSDINGIRDAPYTSDRNVAGDNQFVHTSINILPENTQPNSNNIPHSWGQVWATFLYDLTQNLIDEHGFDPDLYAGTGGNNISLALVTEALKLQPASPGFVDGRDAILAADQALFDGANQCIIWESFANRGLGFSATQGSSNNRADNTDAFDIPSINLTVTETEFCLASGEVSLGGGVVFGGTYSGPGVTDDGNGSTFTFDPITAGVGTHTITYTGTDCNGVSGNDMDTITVTEIIPQLSACTNVTLELGTDGTVTFEPFRGLDVDIVARTTPNGNSGLTLFAIDAADITEDTTISFNWEFNSTNPGEETLIYLDDNTVFRISNTTDLNQSGNFTFDVTAGVRFGFGTLSNPNVATGVTATISNFSPGYSGQFAQANWNPLLQDSNGTANFNGNLPPSLVSCGELTTTLSQSVFTCLDIGTTTPVTITVTDSLGNADTCVANVTVTGGSLNTTTFTGGAWNNGEPTGTSMAIVSDNYDTATLGDINACSCQINTNQTVIVRDDDFMNIAGNIVVDGTLIVENEGSVVQLDNGAITTNNGTIEVRKTTPLLEPRDFVLLSSPMNGESSANVFASADRVFLIDPTLFDPDASTVGSETGVTFLDVEGDYFSPATTLNVGEGYIVFPQAVSDVGNVNFDHTYTEGTLNSGTIEKTLVYNGPETTNNFNVLGNPYPSAIDTDLLIGQNTAINEVYFWEHITEPNESLPGFNNNNFSMDDVSLRNLMGGVASANGGTAPGQFMTSGQGFGILANETFNGTPLTFTNDMRVTGNNGTVRSSENPVDRLWLRLDSEDFTLQSITLLGFIDGATISFDEGFDSQRLATTMSLYAIGDDDQELTIQAREAFNPEIEIALGFATTIPENENYSISIDQFEGVNLENNEIFLWDTLLNQLINLKENSYAFTATESIQNNRFILVFEDQLLSTNDNSLRENSITLFPNPTSSAFTLSYTGSEQLIDIRIIDLNGKIIQQINTTSVGQNNTIDISNLKLGLYFIQAQTENTVITKKIIKN